MYSFRAWDKNEEEMLDHMQILHTQEHRGLRTGDQQYDVFQDRSLHFMLCLGIEDSHGQTIFEGDIIETRVSKLDGFVYIVAKNQANGSFVCKPFKKGGYNKRLPMLFQINLPTLDMLKTQEITVLGNVFENKELIEKEILK